MRADNINVILHNMSSNPEDWRLDNFHAIHRNGLKIWIGNGLVGYHIEKPKYQELSWYEKFKIQKQIKILTKKK